MTPQQIKEQLPAAVKAILEKALPLLEQGRPGDVDHVYDMLETILEYRSEHFDIDLSIMLPLAILHDIGHEGVLPEHFVHLTGANKIKNGKLVHMLIGAKTAQKILEELQYPQAKAKEIVEIVAMHDADQVEGMGNEAYDTQNKKIFHDFDRLGMFNVARLRKFMAIGENRAKKDKLKKELETMKNSMFFDEFQRIADEKWETILPIIEGA